MRYRILQQEPFISYGHMNLKNDMRLLMTELAYLSRFYIISVESGFGDANAIADRLYNLPLKFKLKAELIFGIPLGEELVTLLSLHVVHLQTLVNALKNGDQAAANDSAMKLYQNANDISTYYAKINPFWELSQWRNLLNTYIRTLIDETIAIMTGDFEKGLDIFERLLLNALYMGDYLADGIIQYLTVTRRNTNMVNLY